MAQGTFPFMEPPEMVPCPVCDEPAELRPGRGHHYAGVFRRGCAMYTWLPWPRDSHGRRVESSSQHTLGSINPAAHEKTPALGGRGCDSESQAPGHGGGRQQPLRTKDCHHEQS
jgi:hypothetical protein